MARYEAHLQCPGLELGAQQQVVQQLATAVDVELTWLDRRNASMGLLLPPQGLSVRVLLECQANGKITMLLSGREGMAKGAPQSRACFEHLLALLLELLPAAQVMFRSDRDGPIRGSTATRAIASPQEVR